MKKQYSSLFTFQRHFIKKASLNFFISAVLFQNKVRDIPYIQIIIIIIKNIFFFLKGTKFTKILLKGHSFNVKLSCNWHIIPYFIYFLVSDT